MKFQFSLAHKKRVSVELAIPFWFGKTRVYVNEKEAFQLEEKGKPYDLKLPDGSMKKMYVKNSFMDVVPKVFIDGEEILFARKLLWYEYFLALMPLVLLVAGAIGGLFGGGAMVFNLRIWRTDFPLSLKVGLNIAITFIAFILTMVAALIVSTLLGGSGLPVN